MRVAPPIRLFIVIDSRRHARNLNLLSMQSEFLSFPCRLIPICLQTFDPYGKSALISFGAR